LVRPRPAVTLFPYTTLFRSVSALAEMFAAFVDEANAPRLLTRSLSASSAADQLTSFVTGDEFIAQGRAVVARFLTHWQARGELGDRKSTRLNYSHVKITYAV